MQTREIPAGEFKQHCLALMREIATTGEEVIITSRGTPLCRMVPIKKKSRKSSFGCRKGTFTIIGDITKPVDVEWDACK